MVKHAFELAGRAFYDVSDFRRKNVLSIVGENCMQLIENRDVFNALEHKNLLEVWSVNHRQIVEKREIA